MSYSVISWGVTVALVAAGVYVYRPDLIQKVIPQAPVSNTQHESLSTQQAKRSKSKKTGSVNQESYTTSQSSAQGTSKSKKRKISAPVDNKVEATTTQGEKKELPRVVDDDVDDKDFAQQLAKAQAGTKLQGKPQPGVRGKAATNLQPSTPATASTTDVSSNAGQDADDDLTPADSPDQRPVSGNDISDMLERPAAAPTSLRLTNTEEKKSKQKPQQFEAVVSKKKRNEQARREEQKRLREESDKIHEQKKQEQLRRARMAEGTSNQTKANSFTNTSNAWQKKPAAVTQDQSGPETVQAAPLLDTFKPVKQNNDGAVQAQAMSDITDQQPSSNSANGLKSRVGESKAEALAASEREAPSSSWAEQMSEEEQMEKLREQESEDAWEAVTSKKGKKQNKSRSGSGSEAAPAPAQPTSAPKVQKPQTNGAKTNGVSKPATNTNRFETIVMPAVEGLQDDEWGA